MRFILSQADIQAANMNIEGVVRRGSLKHKNQLFISILFM
jgi:hypothetical protein